MPFYTIQLSVAELETTGSERSPVVAHSAAFSQFLLQPLLPESRRDAEGREHDKIIWIAQDHSCSDRIDFGEERSWKKIAFTQS